MNFPRAMVGNHLVHEGQEIHAPATLGVMGLHLTRGDVERRKQVGGAMAFVLVGIARDRPPVWKLEPSLRPFQGLDVRLLVHREHHGVVRRVQIEATISAALAANSGSVLMHQERRRCKAIPLRRSTFQTYCASTSPKARESSCPFQPA